MMPTERNARLAAVLVGAVFAGWAYLSFKSLMHRACSCCDTEQWSFKLTRWLAAAMCGLIVYYILQSGIGARWRKPKGKGES
jgi:hypothetical protein